MVNAWPNVMGKMHARNGKKSSSDDHETKELTFNNPSLTRKSVGDSKKNAGVDFHEISMTSYNFFK